MSEHPLDVLGHALEVLHREIAVAPYTEERERAALRAVEQLEQAARDMLDWLEEQDPFPTSDGHPIYEARAALALFDRKEQTP